MSLALTTRVLPPRASLWTISLFFSFLLPLPPCHLFPTPPPLARLTLPPTPPTPPSPPSSSTTTPSAPSPPSSPVPRLHSPFPLHYTRRPRPVDDPTDMSSASDMPPSPPPPVHNLRARPCPPPDRYSPDRYGF